MKLSNKVFLGLLILAVTTVLMGCASMFPTRTWDSDTPKAERVELYYSEKLILLSVNGVEKGAGVGIVSVGATYQGRGDGRRDKAAVSIPPGQSELVFQIEGGGRQHVTARHNFEPGGHYRLIQGGMVQEQLTQEQQRRYAQSVLPGAEPIDITDLFYEWKVEKIK